MPNALGPNALEHRQVDHLGWSDRSSRLRRWPFKVIPTCERLAMRPTRKRTPCTQIDCLGVVQDILAAKHRGWPEDLNIQSRFSIGSNEANKGNHVFIPLKFFLEYWSLDPESRYFLQSISGNQLSTDKWSIDRRRCKNQQESSRRSKITWLW